MDVRLGTGLDAVAPRRATRSRCTSAARRWSSTSCWSPPAVAPNVDDLGLETVGLDGPLTVDDTGLVQGVDGEWLYAAGDVTGRAPLTHQGKYDARIVGAAIGARAAGGPVDTAPWGEHVATADHAAVPQVVFTDPEVASVGLTEAQARDAGLRIRVVDLPIAVAGVDDHRRQLRRRGADGRRRGPRRSSSG